MPEDIRTRNLIQRITNLFKRIIPTEPPTTTERDTLRIEGSKLIELKPARLTKYKDYEEMDEEIVEISSALDIYGDFIVSATGHQEVYNVEFEDEGLKREGEIVESLEDRLSLKERSWFMCRNLVKYRDAFYEQVAAPEMLVKLKFLPTHEIFVNYDKEGRIDPEHPYVQKEETFTKTIAEFEPWEIVHFKIGEEDYGVNYSMLSKLRRTYKVLRMLEDTLLVTRMTRAGQRGIYKVDVTGMSPAEAAIYIRKLKLLNRRKMYFTKEGKLKTEFDPLQPHEDIYIPVRKSGAGGEYTVVQGERFLGEIRDILHFHNKLFAGTKVPKAYMGFEKDVNAKATLWQQHIAFVKVTKRFRFGLASGLKKIYRTEFLLNGVDPMSFVWSLKFPAVGSPDEEVAWKIEKIKADVVEQYGKVGMALPIEWIIKKLFLNLSPDEADNLITLMKQVVPATPPPTKIPAAGKEPRRVPVRTPPEPPEEGLGFTRSSGDGDRLVTESELKDLMKKVEDDPRIRELAERVEEAVVEIREGREYDYYRAGR